MIYRKDKKLMPSFFADDTSSFLIAICAKASALALKSDLLKIHNWA